MFRRLRPDRQSRPALSGPPIGTIIGADSNFNGSLQVKGELRIDGVFEGSVEVSGPLVIGEGARVVAEIKATVVSVAGSIKGDITAEKVDILSTGQVYGNLTTNEFTSEEGSYFRGIMTLVD